MFQIVTGNRSQVKIRVSLQGFLKAYWSVLVGFSLKQFNLCPRVYRDHISDCMNLTSNVVISSKSFSNLIWRINQKIRNKSSQMVINSLVKIGLWWKIVYEYSFRDEHGHWIILGSRPLLCEFDESKPVWKRFDNDLDWPTRYSRTKKLIRESQGQETDSPPL